MSRRHIDETDRRIIQALRVDARRSHQSIADELGVSEGTIRTRMRRLVDDGVVKFSTVRNIADFEALSVAYLWIQCDRSALSSVASEIASMAPVGYVATLLGRADLLAIVALPTASALRRYADESVRCLPGVTDVRIEPIVEMVKIDVAWGLVRGAEKSA